MPTYAIRDSSSDEEILSDVILTALSHASFGVERVNLFLSVRAVTVTNTGIKLLESLDFVRFKRAMKDLERKKMIDSHLKDKLRYYKLSAAGWMQFVKRSRAASPRSEIEMETDETDEAYFHDS